MLLALLCLGQFGGPNLFVFEFVLFCGFEQCWLAIENL